jgi:hypothetical protein
VTAGNSLAFNWLITRSFDGEGAFLGYAGVQNLEF